MNAIIDKIKKLINAMEKEYPGDIEALDMIKDNIVKASKYVETVIDDEMASLIASECGHQNVHQRERTGKTRTIAHNSWIDACIQLNRWSEGFGLDKFYDGPLDDRTIVGDFAMEVTRNIFDSRFKGLSNDEFVRKIAEEEFKEGLCTERSVLDYEIPDKEKNYDIVMR